MGILEIERLSHSFGDHKIFHDAALSLNRGEHAGVVGQNGVGKSTLIRFCTGELIPDEGTVRWQPGVSRGYLDQYALMAGGLSLGEFLRSAFRELYQMEAQAQHLYEQAAQGDPGALERASLLQEELERRDFYTVDARVKEVARGLGLSALGMDRSLGQMSGGQRAKAILGKLLLEQPDVLLLDEPTNFLDREHVDWLGGYLKGLSNAFLVVTHDFRFLEAISTCVFDLSGGKIEKYSGSYSHFLQKRAQRREDYLRRYTAQQREIQRTEEFIRKNLAGQRTRMAQGRRKQLLRMERLEAPKAEASHPIFQFAALPVTKAEHLTVRDLLVGYSVPLLPPLSFQVKGGSRVAVTGFNGVGKTTLLKTLTGELSPLSGYFRFSPQVRLGYFRQDLLWEDPSRTPLQAVTDQYPRLTQKEARALLARCGVSQEHTQQPLFTLSGGEQARVKLCLLTQAPCNFLILDEPTNHLDENAREALKIAIQGFPGTILLVSHETSFYEDWAAQILRL